MINASGNEPMGLDELLQQYMGTHTAVIYGEKLCRRYVSRYHSNSMSFHGTMRFHDEPQETLDYIGPVKIGEYELSNPPLKQYERIFLHEIGESTSISKVQRSTENKWNYHVKHAVEIIDDEETLKSYEKALAEIEKYYKEREPEPRSDPYHYGKGEEKQWWQFWK